MRNRSFWLSIGCLILLVGATLVYIVYTLQFSFGGYDLSPLIDVGWRVASGQSPNRDFICTFPPLLYLGTAAAFKVFGVTWRALSMASVIYSATLTLLSFRILFLLRKQLDRRVLLGLAWTFASLQMLPILLVGHPWHSSWTEAAILLAFITTFAIAQLSSADVAAKWVARELRIYFGVALMLLILAKPNTAMPALFVCTFALLLRPHRLLNVVAPLGFSLLFASLLLFATHTNLLETYKMYFALDSRLGNNGRFEELFSNPIRPGGFPDVSVYIAVFPTFIWTLYASVKNLRSHDLRWASTLGLGGILITILGLGTNFEFRLVDIPCLLLGAALLGATVPEASTWFLRGAFAQAIFSLLIIGVFDAETRVRMEAVGQWGADTCGSTIEQSDKFFGDFHDCNGFFSVLAETDVALASHPAKRVFFGPRMEFLYARDHVHSPPGLPLWWHPGSSYPNAALADVVRAWRVNNFDLLIFLHNDRTRIPAAILETVQAKYRLVPSPLLPQFSSVQSLPDAQVDVYVLR